MRCFTSIATLLVLIAASALAHADEPSPLTTPNQLPPPRLHLTGGLGAYGASDGGSGAVVECLFVGRIGPVAIGANLQGGGPVELFAGNRFVSIAGVAGAYAPTPRWLEVGALATVGVRQYYGLAYELLGDPGFDATLPYAGIRGILGVAGDGPGARFAAGIHGFVDTDIGHREESYSYEAFSLFGDDPTVSVSHVAGRWQYGGIFAIGATF